MSLFAAAIDTNALGTLGVPGLVVIIVVLATVFVYRETKFWPGQMAEYKAENKELRAKNETIQDERLKQAIETRDKLAEPMQNMTALMQNILTQVTNGKR